MSSLFPPPGDIFRERREVMHLKAMASICRMIESLTVGTSLTIAPNAVGGWTITRSVEEDIYNADSSPIDKKLGRTPSPPEPLAAKLIEAEIEERTDFSAPMP